MIFAIGSWNIRTALKSLVPTSHSQRVVGMLSVLVAKRVPELSNVRMFVPAFMLWSLWGESDVGGQMIWVASVNSLENPASDGTACSCQICIHQQMFKCVADLSILELCLQVLSLYNEANSKTP